MTTDDRVALATFDGVAVLTLDEPKARNPLSPELVVRLTERLKALETEPTVRAVVLVGAGHGFSAGADLRRMRSATPLEDREEYARILELNRTLWNFGKPTVAAVHGFALGAGANLMCWCDLAVAEVDARIGYPEVSVGIAAATVVPTLMRMVSRKRMCDLVLTGRSITAVEALDAGLVSSVVETGQAYEAALETARTIADHDPLAVALTKEVIRTTTDMSYEHAIEHAKELRVISRLRDDLDVRMPGGDGA